MTTTTLNRRLAFDLRLDLRYGGIDPNTVDMDAVTALFVAECNTRGYEFTDAADPDATREAHADWADTNQGGMGYPADETTAWQAVHDAVGYTDILALTETRP